MLVNTFKEARLLMHTQQTPPLGMYFSNQFFAVCDRCDAVYVYAYLDATGYYCSRFCECTGSLSLFLYSEAIEGYPYTVVRRLP